MTNDSEGGSAFEPPFFYITAKADTDRVKASEIARTHQLPFFSEVDFTKSDFILNYARGSFSLLVNPELGIGKEILIDTSLKNITSLQGMQLLKACSASQGSLVFDATAGLGKDALCLSAGGATVYAAEKQQLLRLMLEYALPKEIPLYQGNALMLLNHPEELKIFCGRLPDVIYLDPMFPPKKKSAKVKKEMQVLHMLCGEDANAADLLSAATKLSVKRIVVKRMKSSPMLSSPTRSLVGKSNRFDIYEN